MGFNKDHYSRGLQDGLEGSRPVIAVGDYFDGYKQGRLARRLQQGHPGCRCWEGK